MATSMGLTTVTQSPASSSPILLCMCSLLLQVVARYGYQDGVDHSEVFVSKLISTIMFKLEMKAGLKYQVWGKDWHQGEGECVSEENTLGKAMGGGAPGRQGEGRAKGSARG